MSVDEEKTAAEKQRSANQVRQHGHREVSFNIACDKAVNNPQFTPTPR